MEIKNIWSKEQVANYLKGIQVNVELDPDYIYDVYEMANEFIGIVDQENAQIEVKEINQFELLLYCVGEYYYLVIAEGGTEVELVGVDVFVDALVVVNAFL